jgi:hypothetical protein
MGLYSAKAIFSRLKINVTFDTTYLNDDTGALQQVIDGKADAWIVGTAKVMPIARNLKNEDRRLHLVSIPYDKRLQDLYLPSEFTSNEYPNLIPPGEKIDTVASGILLACFNWPEKNDRYQMVAKFVGALFSRIGECSKPPRHPKWKEASITVVTRRLWPNSRNSWRNRAAQISARKGSPSCTHNSRNGIAAAKTDLRVHPRDCSEKRDHPHGRG